MVKIGGETVAIELIKTVFGGYPHIAVAVLTHGVDETAGETVRRDILSCQRVSHSTKQGTTEGQNETS